MSKSPSLRRIQADIRELSLDPSDQYYAAPLESDMHEWHFTIRGPAETDFAGGIYHGRILLPPEYPFKPPHIIFLTPSGRFETNKKICLSFSAFHPELWQPAWGIRLILEALIAFLPSPADGAIGALDWSPAERRRLAKKSRDFVCPHCGKVEGLLPPLKESSSPAKPSRFQKEIAQLQMMQNQEHQKSEEEEGKDQNKDHDEQTSKESELASESNATPMENEASPIPAVMETGENDENVKSPTVVTSSDTTHQSTPVVNAPVPVTPTPPTMPPPRVAEMTNEQPPVMDRLAAAAEEAPEDQVKPSWLVEPVVHSAILLLSVICLLLVRKIQALCVELRALED